jgi:hypothetical protein
MIMEPYATSDLLRKLSAIDGSCCRGVLGLAAASATRRAVVCVRASYIRTDALTH